MSYDEDDDENTGEQTLEENTTIAVKDRRKKKKSKSNTEPQTVRQLPLISDMNVGKIQQSGKLRIVRTWEIRNSETDEFYSFHMILIDKSVSKYIVSL